MDNDNKTDDADNNKTLGYSPKPLHIQIDEYLSNREETEYYMGLYEKESKRYNIEKRRADKEMQLADRETILADRQSKLADLERDRAKIQIKRIEEELERAYQELLRAHDEKLYYFSKTEKVQDSLDASINELRSFLETLPLTNPKLYRKYVDEYKTLMNEWINEEKSRKNLEVERAYRDRELTNIKYILVCLYGRPGITKLAYQLEKDRADREQERVSREKERVVRERKRFDHELKRTRRECENADYMNVIADILKERADREKEQADLEANRADRFDRLLAHKFAVVVKTCRHYLYTFFSNFDSNFDT